MGGVRGRRHGRDEGDDRGERDEGDGTCEREEA